MFGTDHFYGSFEFETELHRLETGEWEASALGLKAVHRDQSQALNDLNAAIDAKVSSGEIRPDILGG